MSHANLWERHAAGDEAARAMLLQEHLGLVHYIARQLSRGPRAEIELDELLSAGTLGLTAAVDAFDPSRGLQFSTFAATRIRGAILDELRRQDHVPRSVRRKTRELRAATDAIGGDEGAPNEAALSERLGVDVATLRRWQLDVEAISTISLDGPSGPEDDGRPTHAELLAGSSDEDIEADVAHRQEVNVLTRLLGGLNEQERTVLMLYYYEDLKLHEIAIALGVSESRISQIRTKALGKLRTHMNPLRREVA